MTVLLVPIVPVPERAIQTALTNIIEGIADLVEDEAGTLMVDWAEAAGTEATNIFMKEKAARILVARLLAFMDDVVPEPAQLTGEHVAAYSTPLPPPTDNPKPEPK
jgi:hypothetical protein